MNDNSMQARRQGRGARIRTRLGVAVLAVLLVLGAAPWPSPAPARADNVSEDERKVINAYLDSAFNAYLDKDYHKAMIHFQKVLEINPKDKAAQRGVKQCRKRLGKARVDKSQSYKKMMKFVKKLIKQEKWLDAIDNLEEIVTNTPNQIEAIEMRNEIGALLKQRMAVLPLGSPNHLIYQGILYYYNKRYQESVRVWKEAAAMFPDDIKLGIYIQRAEQLHREAVRYEISVLGRQRAREAFDTGSYEEAAILWRKIVEFDPNDEEAKAELARADDLRLQKSRESLIGDHYDKGLQLYSEQKLDESLREWKSILEIDPANEVAREYTVKITQQLEDRTRSSAKAKPKKAKAEPKRPAPDAEPQIGKLDLAGPGDPVPGKSGPSAGAEMQAEDSLEPVERRSRPARASEQILEDPVKRRPEPLPVKKTGRPVPASPGETASPKRSEPKAPAPKAVRTPPSASPDASSKMKSLGDASYEVGITHFRDGKYQESIDFFQKLLNRVPDDRKAREWLDKVKKEQNGAAEKYYNQGLVAYSQGKTGDAIKAWQAALKANPNHTASRRALTKVTQ